MKHPENLDLFKEGKQSSVELSFEPILKTIQAMPFDEMVDAINTLREMIHNISPFRTEPVDFVKWVKNNSVYSNDYNPNVVAPVEMELLKVSIDADGYTQPIVSMNDGDGKFEVIDGFHRHRVGKEMPTIAARVHGYLPLVQINESRKDKADRIASTIRHNRARGKHKVDAMSDIVVELKKRNWSDEKIAKNLGMDADEVLRLCQISGLAELFQDSEFSMSWDIDDIQDEFIPLDDSAEDGDIAQGSGRILHTYEKWECYPAGFYDNKKEGWTKEQCEEKYAEFLGDLDQFKAAMQRVITEWKYSCEHYLTNDKMNRIAWMGQASACIAYGIPSCYRGGFHMLSESQQQAANEAALEYLNKWMVANGRDALTMEQAQPKTEANLY